MVGEENQENALKVMLEEIEVVVEKGESKAFYSHKGVEVFQKHLEKKSFMEERGFKELVLPVKEEIERRGWEKLSQHRELGVQSLVKEFYANLGEQKNLTCYVKGRLIPFGERAISQLLGLRPMSDCKEYDQLQENLKFKEIVKELTDSLGVWQRTKTIYNAYIDKGNLSEVVKVWFYFINLVVTASKHILTMRQDRVILLYALVKGFNLNVRKIVEQSILDYPENKFSWNIPHPTLIILLCIKRV